jgi:hypothetical protein
MLIDLLSKGSKREDRNIRYPASLLRNLLKQHGSYIRLMNDMAHSVCTAGLGDNQSWN